MKRLESNFINMVLSTTIVALLAAGILGYVYTVTKDPIAATKKAKQEQAIKDVLPEGATIYEPKICEVNGCTIYPARDADDNFVGAAVESQTNGFGGNVKIMVGFDKYGHIINYAVLEQAETPGLGVKMTDWFKTDKGDQSILGKQPAINNLTVNKDGGEVDAITAATISSRAFLLAVHDAYAAFAERSGLVNVDVTTGASGKNRTALQREVDNVEETAEETVETVEGEETTETTNN
ncbi:MAG: RnfABCDGE type electron transport complex subunit G [Bacteroidales bacterium]|nr:RnfABCDGE type electron transport complex subunit G [Bacteroidales bacterium]